jgi:hypothetical protein
MRKHTCGIGVGLHFFEQPSNLSLRTCLTLTMILAHTRKSGHLCWPTAVYGKAMLQLRPRLSR